MGFCHTTKKHFTDSPTFGGGVLAVLYVYLVLDTLLQNKALHICGELTMAHTPVMQTPNRNPNLKLQPTVKTRSKHPYLHVQRQ
jgi:hypothetical protein